MIWLPFILVIFIWFIFKKSQSSKAQLLPPGPQALPVIGSLWLVLQDSVLNKIKLEQWFIKMANKYGDLVTLTIGVQKFIVFSTYQSVHEAFITSKDSNNFSGRPQFPLYQVNRYGLGVLLSEGDMWKIHRRFALKTFRNFGVGKSLIEEKITQEAHELIQELLAQSNPTVNPADLVSKAVCNVISQIIFGQRTGYADPNFKEYLQAIRDVTQNGSISTFAPAFWPVLGADWIFKRLPGASKMFEGKHRLSKLCKEKYDELSKTFDASVEPTNYMEAYLKEKNDLDTASCNQIFTIAQLLQMCEDLFLAGTDTTSSTIMWCFLYLGKYPEIQKRLYEEISNNKLKQVEFVYSNREHFPIAMAFIDEVYRLSSILPHSVDKRVVKDTMFRGYLIPSDAIIHINLYAIHRDPSLWSNPKDFSIDRFLNDDKKYQSSPYLNPFGIGKRSCLGEILARMEIFLVLINAVNTVEINLSEKTASHFDSIMFGTHGVINGPLDHSLLLKKR